MRPLILFALVAAVGCSTPKADVDVRALPIFNGDDGRPMTWDDVMTAIGGADFVIVGEQHDDATGHAVQLAVVEDVLERWPDSAVSMEMLERDEQGILDDYLDGIVGADVLVTVTRSLDWGGPDGWHRFYQPIVDAAKSAHGAVVAANAPRRYVSLARTEGYERIEALPQSRRDLAALPVADAHDEYRARFQELMTDDAMGGHQVTEEDLGSLFDSQLVWDATMADSMAAARRAGARKVVHLVGQFHVDFDGGLVVELRARVPDARVVVISMQPVSGGAMRPEDMGRADVVVYTGS